MLWVIQAYQKVTPMENGQEAMINVSEATVHADSEEEAIKKVKKILPKRKYYRAARVNEEHPEELTETQVLQLEMQKKMLDAIKG